MRNLFPVIPHYWIWKTKYYTAYRSWLGAVYVGGRSVRVLSKWWGNPHWGIYLNRSLHLCQASNLSFIISFITTTKMVVSVTVPAVISRNIMIGFMIGVLTVLRLHLRIKRTRIQGDPLNQVVYYLKLFVKLSWEDERKTIDCCVT